LFARLTAPDADFGLAIPPKSETKTWENWREAECRKFSLDFSEGPRALSRLGAGLAIFGPDGSRNTGFGLQPCPRGGQGMGRDI